MAKGHKGHLGMGIVMLVSFFVVLFLIFSPIFPKTPEGAPQNGLEFSDRMFNRLAKGSSYFIPKVMKSNEKFMGKMINVTLAMDKPADQPGDAEKRAELNGKLYGAVEGTKVKVAGSELKIEGDLGKLLASALQDSDAMFNNEGEKLKEKYASFMDMADDDEKKIFRQWHNSFTKLDKELKKQKMIEEANMVSTVMKKAIETAYNFYGILPQKVSEKAGLMSGLLVFYVVYTLWYGFAIFFIFEGIGLSMKKAKVKKEV